MPAKLLGDRGAGSAMPHARSRTASYGEDVYNFTAQASPGISG